MHKLLHRQLLRHVGTDREASSGWKELLEAVDAAYQEADTDRKLLERSLELSSQELVARNRELRESAERYALAMRGANDGLWDWDLRAARIYYSARWNAMLGYDDAQLSNLPEEWFGRVHPDDIEQFQISLNAHLNGTTPHFEHEHRIQHADGTWRWMLARGLAVRDEAGRATRMAGSLTDTSERRRAADRLLQHALRDDLTGLPNRAVFLDVLRRAVVRAKRHPESLFAVLFIDLDRFKMINDGLGHAAGDELLISVARRLESCLRQTDTAARHGGDEFTVLVDEIRTSKDAERVAERIHQVLREPLRLGGGQEVFCSASIGIAVSAPSYERPEDILRDADTAMYRAKSQGKARHVCFDATMHSHALELLQLENDLRRALLREEFVVHYQPILRVASGTLAGFEALVRWAHPQRGLLKPSSFIPVAEETGLIVNIGQWVLRESTRQLARWRRSHASARHVTLSVNLSARELVQPALAHEVMGVLEAQGLAASDLKLEITETVLIENQEEASEVIEQLRQRGLRLQMDDFGTGFSSLSYLHRFPVDELKVDRAFVSGLESEAKNAEIVRTILTLARNLGKEVVAEGVETRAQLDFLRELGCTYAQGFLFAAPLEASAAESYIREHHPQAALVETSSAA